MVAVGAERRRREVEVEVEIVGSERIGKNEEGEVVAGRDVERRKKKEDDEENGKKVEEVAELMSSEVDE